MPLSAVPSSGSQQLPGHRALSQSVSGRRAASPSEHGGGALWSECGPPEAQGLRTSLAAWELTRGPRLSAALVIDLGKVSEHLVSLPSCVNQTHFLVWTPDSLASLAVSPFPLPPLPPPGGISPPCRWIQSTSVLYPHPTFQVQVEDSCPAILGSLLQL